MIDKVSMPEIDDELIKLYELKDFVKSQQPVLEKMLVEKYAGVLESYIKDHEDSIGGLPYSIWKKASEHPKISEPTLRINLRKGNFNNYWAGLFNKIAKETMPEWANIFIEDIGVVYSALNDIKDNNSAFLEKFNNIDIAAEAGISEDLKEMEKYHVDESLFSIYKENISFALNRYNESLQALVEHMSEVGVDPESTDSVADALKDSIAESNKILGVIGDSEERIDVLQGALLLEKYLGEVQKNVNIGLTDCDENINFDDLSLRDIDNRSFIGMLYRLENIDNYEHEFKECAFKSLGYEFKDKTGFEFFKSDIDSGEGKIVSRELYRIAVRKKD